MITIEREATATATVPTVPPEPVVPPPAVDPGSNRLLSLDALRGFDMFWIVGAEGLVAGLEKIKKTDTIDFVSTQLQHVAWEGFHFEDFIFPLFVFLMGVAAVFSLEKHVEKEGKAGAHWRVIRRFVLLYLVGLFYYGGFRNQWGGDPGIRLVGVLPRIATCYLFAGLLFLNLRLRGLIVALVLILGGYWAVMTFVPMPGMSEVSFQPEQNIANYIDLHYLPGRLWDHTWDPEGLLSTIPAIGSALLGIFAGMLLKNQKISGAQKVALLIVGGAAITGLGYLWGFQFPIIKKLWTSSYVLVAGGCSAMILGLFYLVIDVWKLRAWATPFFWIGANALTIYMAENLVDWEKIAARFVGGDIHKAAGDYGDLLIAIVAVSMLVALAGFLYKKKIFIRL